MLLFILKSNTDRIVLCLKKKIFSQRSILCGQLSAVAPVDGQVAYFQPAYPQRNTRGIRSPMSEMCDHRGKDHTQRKTANSKSQQMKHYHQNPSHHHHHSQQNSCHSDDNESHEYVLVFSSTCLNTNF